MAKDYEVGYGKPPKHSQFPPGKSGNPRGRHNGSKGLRTVLQEELSAPQKIKVDGKEIKAPRLVQTIRTLAIRAAAGDLKAQQLLVPLVIQTFGFEDRGAGPAKLSDQDQAILDELLSSPQSPTDDKPESMADGDGTQKPPPPDAPPASDEFNDSEDDAPSP